MAKLLEERSRSQHPESGVSLVGSGFIPVEGNPELMGIREEALQPGNLVYGADFRLSQVEEALRSQVLNKRLATATRFTDQFLAFALLSRKPLPDRYTKAQHYGPKVYPS